MTVNQLRARLDEIIAEGNGECRIIIVESDPHGGAERLVDVDRTMYRFEGRELVVICRAPYEDTQIDLEFE